MKKNEYCPYCQQPIGQESRCPSCHEFLHHCVRCGHGMRMEDTFCAACGRPVHICPICSGSLGFEEEVCASCFPSLDDRFFLLDQLQPMFIPDSWFLPQKGWGEVSLARDISSGSLVELRVYPNQRTFCGSDFSFWLMKECRESQRLQNDSIVKLLAYGQYPFEYKHPHEHMIPRGQRGTKSMGYAIIYEWWPAKTLAHVLREEGPLPWPYAVEVCRQILSALIEAEKIGLTHHDLAPHNILYREGKIKICNFGVSWMERYDSGITIIGNASSAAHRWRADSAPVDETHDPCPNGVNRDLHRGIRPFGALGLLLFEALTGKYPFKPPFWDKDISHLPRLTDLKPEIPDWLEEMMLRLLRGYSAYPSLEECLADLPSVESLPDS